MGNRLSHGASTKEVFDRFNRSHSGKINLDEMVNMAAAASGPVEPGMGIVLQIANSPLVLFHFDVTHEGAINYQEFEELQRQINEAERQVLEQRRQKRPLMARLCGICNKEATPPPSEHKAAPIRAYTTFNKSTRGNAGLLRSSTTPVFTSFKSGSIPASATAAAIAAAAEASGGEGDNDGSFPTATPVASTPGSGEDAAVTAAVMTRIVDDARQFFLSKLKNKEGREAYKQWLFKLTDVEHRGIITLDELRLILRAVERDGVRAQRLCFDLVDRSHASRAVMDEYAHGRSVMTHDEFMVLAEIVLQEYEFAQKCALRSHAVGKYRLTRLLGAGANGAVMYAFDMETGAPKAVKIVKRGRIRDMSRLDCEIKAMGMLQHPNVVSLEEVLQTDEHVFLVMEVCGGGCLFDALPEDRTLTEAEARHYFYQIMQSLKYCHSAGVCHRDLRLENVLLDNNGTVKISDFGHAGIFEADWDLFSTTLVGSLYHISPEQIANKAYSGQRLDMWAAGITLYRLLVGEMPFHSSNMQDFFAQVSAARYEIPSTVSPAAAALVKRMLSVNPEHRPLPDEVLADPWMNGEKVAPPLLCIWLPIMPGDDESTIADFWGAAVHAVASLGMVVNERPAGVPIAHAVPARSETVEMATLTPHFTEPQHYSDHHHLSAPLQPPGGGGSGGPQLLTRAESAASGLHSMGTSGSEEVSDTGAGIGIVRMPVAAASAHTHSFSSAGSNSTTASAPVSIAVGGGGQYGPAASGNVPSAPNSQSDSYIAAAAAAQTKQEAVSRPHLSTPVIPAVPLSVPTAAAPTTIPKPTSPAISPIASPKHSPTQSPKQVNTHDAAFMSRRSSDVPALTLSAPTEDSYPELDFPDDGDVRMRLPVLRVANCIDVARGLKFVLRLRAGHEDPPGNVWLEFQHVSGEIWRFRRVGRRVRAALCAAERDLSSTNDLSMGLPESESMVSLHMLGQSYTGAASEHRQTNSHLRNMLVSTDSMAPMKAVVRFGRDPSPGSASSPALSSMAGGAAAAASGPRYTHTRQPSAGSVGSFSTRGEPLGGGGSRRTTLDTPPPGPVSALKHNSLAIPARAGR